ncbi:MAG TPA: penicillin-binding protein 2 [Gemmatimonadales bacterium]|nr:penicillin-binding protein 2 [Gemmatimonadales bacterium]
MNGFDSYQVRERAGAARWVLSLAFAILIGAFFRTQVLQHDKYQLRAETNRLRAIPLEPPRGPILDRNGRVIAENLPGFSVKLLAASADSLRAVLLRLATVVPLDTGDIGGMVRRWQAARYQPVTVFGDAPFDIVSRLEERRPMLPGLIIQSEPKRMYPQGTAVAHLVGYVSEVTETDLERNRFPGASLGSIVGKAGLERQYDSVLRGRAGVRYAEVNARGRLVREDVGTASLPPVAGHALQTTLDIDLQRFIDSMWPPGVRGAMIAITPKGEIRALYSAPSYDPNLFVGGISTADWRRLNDDPAIPLLNRAIYGRYPPASPFKLATAAMALKRNLITLRTRMPVPCTGGYRLGNRVFRCWKPEGHGSLDLVGAVAQSCDVYFYQVGQRLGLDAIVEEGVAMGFAGRSGIDLPSEQSSIYPTSLAYFDSLYGPRRWSAPATILNFSIGQGENTQTLINMVQFYQALSGNGVEVQPYIVRPTGRESHSLGLSDEQLRVLRRSLIAVLEQGTGARSRRAGLTIAGKTGTAQQSAGKDHGWFLGFAPAEEPVLVVGAIMEESEHGSTVGPYVADALARYILGPDSTRPAPVRRAAVEAVLPRDSAPRPEPVDSNAAAPAPAPALPEPPQ